MTADFTAMLLGGILFGLTAVAFFWWRFGVADTLAFVIVSGGFSAVMDYISSFVVRNYGQSQLVDATNRLNTSDAFIQPNVCRGRLLSWRATAFNSARV